MKIFHKTILIFPILIGLFNAQAIFASETNSASPQSASLPAEVENLLTNADEFTLFSINPDPDFNHQLTNTFQGHAILGQLNIKSVETRTKLIAVLDDGIAQVAKIEAGGMYWSANCFNPRHGIRAIKGDTSVELLICFECGQMQIHSNDGRNWDFGLPIAEGNGSQNVFNGILKQGGVPLPKE
jgi:hypothetical protein